MEEKAKKKNLDPQDIARVAQVQTKEDVNTYLEKGWIIIGMSSEHHSEHGFTLKYHLGWDRNLGETPEIPLTGWRKFIAESKEREANADPDNPFPNPQ